MHSNEYLNSSLRGTDKFGFSDLKYMGINMLHATCFNIGTLHTWRVYIKCEKERKLRSLLLQIVCEYIRNQ